MYFRQNDQLWLSCCLIKGSYSVDSFHKGVSCIYYTPHPCLFERYPIRFYGFHTHIIPCIISQSQSRTWIVVIFERFRNTILVTSTQVHYLSHCTVQYRVHKHSPVSHWVTTVKNSCVPAASRVARSFGSDKLYICLSNKCFNCIQCICWVTDIRP